jgi:hypothetical protein
VLRFGRLAPGLVESYAGPSDLVAQAQEGPDPTAGQLLDETRALRSYLAGGGALEGDRREWLGAQLGALETALEWLDGRTVPYSDLVERCHGVRPRLVPEEKFAAAHHALDGALPGRGDVRRRYQAWLDTQLVASDRLIPCLDALSAELGRLTRERFGLPGGDEVTFELVRDKPWGGNADYLGGLRTRVLINQDRPIGALRLLELVAHEAYPGHHTESACHERLGRPELLAYVYPTPQALISEGIGMLALEALLGDEAEEVGARCLRRLGISYDTETAGSVRRAQLELLPVRANLALMLDEKGMRQADAHAYARRWLLDDDATIDHIVESMSEREWPPYESCYPEGLALCRRFVRGDPGRFRRLLCEQLTPAQLEAESARR